MKNNCIFAVLLQVNIIVQYIIVLSRGTSIKFILKYLIRKFMTKKIFLIPFLVFILFSCSQENDLIKVSNQSQSSIANSPASLLNARDNIIAEYSDVFSNTLIFDSWSEADSTSSLLVNMNVAELSEFQQQHDFSGRAFNSFLYFATVENVVISNLNLNPESLDDLSYEKEEAYDYFISDILTNTISGFKYSSCISDPRKQPFGMYYYMNTFPYIVDVTGNVSNWRHLSINF